MNYNKYYSIKVYSRFKDVCTNIQNIDIRVGGNKSFLPTFIF